MSPLLPYVPLLCLVVGCACLLAWLYVRNLLGHMTTYAEAVDKRRQLLDAQGWWSWLVVKSKGWRTVALSAAAGVAQLVPLLDEWLPQVRDAPWVSLVDQKTANVISLVCTLLIPLVHAQGLAKAAATPPADQG